MARLSGHWLLTASLVGVLASPLAALAQAERPWVDPPPVSGAKAPTPVPAPASPPAGPAAPNPAPVSSRDMSTPSAAEPKERAQTQPASDVSTGKAATEGKVRQTANTERKVRARSRQQASKAARSQKRVVRRRETGTRVSRAQPRNSIERRSRMARYGSIQEGVDAGLEVMRLRTIQLPDGRRIDILIRPDQDIASQLPYGY